MVVFLCAACCVLCSVLCAVCCAAQETLRTHPLGARVLSLPPPPPISSLPCVYPPFYLTIFEI